MNYQETILYIHQTPKFSRELGNRLLNELLAHCNHPENSLKCIHIAGTNGKGSTAMMLAETLRVAGYNVGLFISPYIERFNERIQINGEPIPDDDLARIVTQLRTMIEKFNTPVSEFALDTAAAFCWFRERKVDYVILETGLGGRLDATNIIPRNLVAVIGSVGLDHTQYLGNTYQEIAAEKCGIIKHGCPVVSYPIQNGEVWPVIQRYADASEAPLYIADMPEATEDGMLLNGVNYKLGLRGEFQIYNAATAYKVIEVLRKNGISISEEAVKQGFLHAKNPARFERFGSNIILDGAHNPPAIQALCDSLKAMNQPIWFCTAMMEDKDYQTCISILAKHARGVITTELAMPRCCPSEKLMDEFYKNGVEEVYSLPNPQEAIAYALSHMEENSLLCICGSLYFAGTIRPYLKQL